MEIYTSYLGNKFKLAAAAALTAMLLLSGAGCAKDENPPVIQQAEMPEWAVEDENVDLSVRTTDDRGVKEVYVQFGSGDKIPLAKIDSQKNGEEVANWQVSLNLAPTEYTYSIVAEDKAGNNSDPVVGKITVYSKNSVYGYAWNKNIGIYLPQLLSLENDGVVDNNDKAFIDLVAKYPKAGELVPGIYAELLKLPDLSMEKYSKIDEKDLEAVEDILILASNPEYKKTFEQMLSVGIPDKRQHCSALEAALWKAYDIELDNYDSLKNYSLENLIKDAWTNTSTSKAYASDKWQNFDEVIARLNYPDLVYWYMKANLKYKTTLGGEGWHSPEYVFDKKDGSCFSLSTFFTNCLLKDNSYYYDDFDNHETNATCSISVQKYSNLKLIYGHDVPLVKIDGKIYCYDITGFFNERGPLDTIKDVADRMNPDWSIYFVVKGPSHTTEVVLSEYTKKRFEDKSVREGAINEFKKSIFWRDNPYLGKNEEQPKEKNKWVIEYFESFGE